MKKLLSSLFALALMVGLSADARAQGANPVTQQLQVQVLLYESLKIESNPGLLSLTLNPADPMEQSTVGTVLNYQTNSTTPRKITMESTTLVNSNGDFTVEIENLSLSDVETAQGGGSGGTIVNAGLNLDDTVGSPTTIVDNIEQALGTLNLNYHIDLTDGSSNAGRLAAVQDITTDVVFTLL